MEWGGVGGWVRERERQRERQRERERMGSGLKTLIRDTYKFDTGKP